MHTDDDMALCLNDKARGLTVWDMGDRGANRKRERLVLFASALSLEGLITSWSSHQLLHDQNSKTVCLRLKVNLVQLSTECCWIWLVEKTGPVHLDAVISVTQSASSTLC